MLQANRSIHALSRQIQGFPDLPFPQMPAFGHSSSARRNAGNGTPIFRLPSEILPKSGHSLP